MKIVFIPIVALILMVSAWNACFAQIYKYKDENGNWIFTDSPVTGLENMETLDGTVNSNTGDPNLAQMLQEKFTSQTEVEKASLATVTIRTTAGTGSGFFISSNGYIITNKHVIRGSAGDQERHQKYYTAADEKIASYKKYFSAEKAQLEKIENYLSDYKKYLNSLDNGTLKKREQAKYRAAFNDYERRQQRFEERNKAFRGEKKIYEREKSDYHTRTASANIAKHFTAILKDGSRHDVYLAAESRKYDLALLKLDRVTTPFLSPRNLSRVHQGMPVYAIGSPIGLKDSASSGIVSGIERGYIKTNAQIYPGNSGGPLVSEDGRVIGINTMKELTRKFEGLGFAIPIGAAFQEFSRFITPEVN